MQQRGWRLYVKRAFDVGAASIGLVLAAPVVGAAALAIRSTMGAPVLFRQQRPGLHARPFELWKLRTMHHAASDRVDSSTDAARLTRLGRFLRATSIDELPQLVNVLRGDLSLVGPRPLLMSYLDRYTDEQARRHDVLPGITGWSQVNGRNSLSWPEKLRLDVWYVDHWSLWLDLKVLYLTFTRVLRRDGVANAGHVTMPELPNQRITS